MGFAFLYVGALVNTPLVSIPWILLETHGNPFIYIVEIMATVALETHGNPWKPSPSGNPWKPIVTTFMETYRNLWKPMDTFMETHGNCCI